MPYYSFPPFKPQYFFPLEYKNHSFFKSFFQPYSIIGRFSWLLWNKQSWVRKLFFLNNIENYIPEKTIRNYIGYDALIAFNRGTPGPEQKVTALVESNKRRYFLKFGQTPTSAMLIENEAKILKGLSSFKIAPTLIEKWEGDDYILIKTEFLEGNRLCQIILTEEISDFLIQLSSIRIEAINNYEGELKTGFAHGDFCPWNIMTLNDRICPYDWEMAGYYSLGYDIFTFIFQTNFLLFPQKTNDQILKENHVALERFFNSIDIFDWKPYLIAFAKLKVDNFKINAASKLYKKYKILLIES